MAGKKISKPAPKRGRGRPRKDAQDPVKQPIQLPPAPILERTPKPPSKDIKDKRHNSRGWINKDNPYYSAAEHCAIAIEAGKAGKSRIWIASKIGITRNTLDGWCTKHPEFGEAMALSGTHSQAWWEDIGQNNLLTPGFNGAVWQRNISSRFREDWHERTTVDIRVTKFDAMTDDELAEFIKSKS